MGRPPKADKTLSEIEKALTHPSLTHEMAQNAFTAVKEKFNIAEMMRKNEELF